MQVYQVMSQPAMTAAELLSGIGFYSVFPISQKKEGINN